MQNAKVLIVEDSASLALGYAAQLEDAGHEVSLSENLADARRALTNESFDVGLLDLQLPDGDGLTIFDAWAGKSGGPSVIVVTADGSLNRAIAAMRLGAYDFLVKPVAGSRLLTTVSNAAQQREETQPASQDWDASTLDGDEGFHGFIGGSPAMKAVYRTIESVADSKATVFVTGESGTGKEVTAEAIHAASKRRSGPFVAINCGKSGEFAKAILNDLVANGVFVRMPFVAPQDRCIRVSCGTPKQLNAFEQALPRAIAKAHENLG